MPPTNLYGREQAKNVRVSAFSYPEMTPLTSLPPVPG